jgi:sugar phosphate permease
LWFAALLNYLDRQMLSTMRPSMMKEVDALVSAANFGRLMAVFLWLYALLSPFAGLLADRANRKRILVGSLCVWSFVTLLMGFVNSFTVLYALRAILGVSQAFYIPAALALVADYHPGKTRSLAIGLHTTGIYLGQALSGFGGTVAERIGWSSSFCGLGGIGLAYSVCLWLLLREKESRSQPSLGNRWKSGVVFSGGNTLLRNGAFWVLLGVFTVVNLPGWATKNWLPTLMSEGLRMPMAQAGPVATVAVSMASFVGVLLGGWFSDRAVTRSLKGRVRVGSIGLLLLVPALFALATVHSAFAVGVGAVLFGLGFGIYDVSIMPTLCQFVPPSYRATAYGWMNLTGIAAGAFVTEFLGKAADRGSMNRVFILLSVLVALAVCMNLFLLHPQSRDAQGGDTLQKDI